MSRIFEDGQPPVFRPRAQLRVAVVEASGLYPVANPAYGSRNPFVRILHDSNCHPLVPQEIGRTAVVHNTTNPVWDQMQPLNKDAGYFENLVSWNSSAGWKNSEEEAKKPKNLELDFSRSWKTSDGKRHGAAWLYPILQPLQTKGSRLMSWNNAPNELLLEVYDQDSDNTFRLSNIDPIDGGDTFLGCVRIPLSSLSSKKETNLWLDLEKSGDAIKDSFLISEDALHSLGRLHVVARIDLPISRDFDDATDLEWEEQALLVSMLSKKSSKLRVVSPDDDGMMSQFYNARSEVERMQHLVLGMTRYAERMYNLWNWTHPEKTTYLLLCVICVTIVVLILPANYSIAAFISCQYMTGIINISVKTKMCKTPEKTFLQRTLRSSACIRLMNLLNSLPDKEQLAEVFTMRKLMSSAKERVTKQNVALCVSLGVHARWTGSIRRFCAYDKSTLQEWHEEFAMIGDCAIRFWESRNQALAGNPPAMCISLIAFNEVSQGWILSEDLVPIVVRGEVNGPNPGDNDGPQDRNISLKLAVAKYYYGEVGYALEQEIAGILQEDENTQDIPECPMMEDASRTDSPMFRLKKMNSEKWKTRQKRSSTSSLYY